MRKLILMLVVMLVAGLPAFAEDMTLDQVIDKNIEARGGEEAWSEVKSAKITGMMTMGPGMELPMTMYFMRPGKVRMEMEMQGQQIVQAYDGESGWQIFPMMGKPDAQKMSDDEVKMVKRQADFEGPLVDWKEKGHNIELVGKEDVDGTEAYKLKVTLDTGDVAYTYLDAEYFLEFKQETTIANQAGQDMKANVVVGDYKEVSGLMLAHSMEFIPEGAPAGMQISFSSIEINPEDVNEQLFAMPAPAAAAAEK
ncbi:MAG: hypothetical protein AAGM22_30155 [Acidobacteriota bacterium]